MAKMTGCPVPNNINPLTPNGYRLSVEKLPNLSYFAQEADLPSIDLPSIPIGTPFSVSQMAGEMLTFSDFQINFLIDENMDNYVAIHNWMIGLGFPESYEQYKSFKSTDDRNLDNTAAENLANYSDGFLQILGSNNNPVRTVMFKDLYPTSLGTVTFQSTVNDIQYLVATATFRYTYYKIE